MAVLCGMPIIQYSALSVRLSVHNLTSCLLPAFDDAECHVFATEWYQRYLPCYLFKVYNSGLLFLHVGQPGGTLDLTFYITLRVTQWANVGH